MLKTIIVDDEPKSRESLKKLLQLFCGRTTEVIASCGTVDEAVEAIKTYQPDVVFLDVEMSGETGFDVLEQTASHEFHTIFITAHAEYAIQAIKSSARDYLLKPVSADELVTAVERVNNVSKARHKAPASHPLVQMQPMGEHAYRLPLPTSEGLIFINTPEILYLKASGNYTEIFTVAGEKHLVSRQLKEFEEVLAHHNFFRIHHSYLVNLAHVKRYYRGEGGYVVVGDDIALDVSRRRKEKFLERIGYRQDAAVTTPAKNNDPPDIPQT